MGRPKGSKTNPNKKIFKEALLMELARKGGSVKKGARKIAAIAIDNAIDNRDPLAAREIMDRIDGKPAQATEITGSLERTYVVNMPLDDVPDLAQTLLPSNKVLDLTAWKEPETSAVEVHASNMQTANKAAPFQDHTLKSNGGSNGFKTTEQLVEEMYQANKGPLLR